MSSVCQTCCNKIQSMRKAVRCSEENCQNLCHADCLVENTSTEGWRCDPCSNPTTFELMRQIKLLITVNKSLGESLNSCHEKLDENNAMIKSLDLKIAECHNKVNEVTAKCQNLEEENLELKSEINKLQQYSRLNCIDVFGVPEPADENIMSTVMLIARALSVQITMQDIDCCHRVNRKRESAEPRGMIIKFVSRWKKDEFVNARRVRRNLCAGDVFSECAGQTGKRPIYIHNSLSSGNRVLYNKCREFKKCNNIKFLWIRNGKILMRQSEKSNVFVIESERSLSDVH